MDSHIDVELLDRYLTDACSPDERRTVEQWLAEDPARTLAGLNGAAQYPAQLGDGDAAWARVSATLHAPAGRVPMRDGVRPGTLARGLGRSPTRLGLIAGFAITLGVITWSVIPRWQAARSAAPTDLARVYTTRAGERASITLADGSHVILGPATRLNVVANASVDGVSVDVRGEALFTVSHHANRSFLVRAHNADVRVLGTTFIVRQYDTDRHARVLVRDGRVMVRSIRGDRTVVPSAVLTARMLGVVDDSGGVQVTPNVSVDDYSVLASGRLVFRKTPIRDVVAELARTYGVEIQVSDSVLAAATVSWNCPVTTQSVERALRELALLVDAHYVRIGRAFTLVPGPTSSRRSAPRPSFAPELQYGR